VSIQAVVRRKTKQRKARGFSRAELKEVGLGFKDALRLALPIDSRRRTKHEENVRTLKENLKRDLKKA